LRFTEQKNTRVVLCIISNAKTCTVMKTDHLTVQDITGNSFS